MDAGYRLGDETDRDLHELVDSGLFETREQVLQEGVRLIRQQTERRAKLLDLVRPALESLQQGRGIPAEEVFDRLIAKYQKMAEERRR